LNLQTSDSNISKTVDTQICAVTIYTEQARVRRRGVVALDGQEKKLLILGLPIILNPESLRVSGAGTQPVRVLEISTKLISQVEPVEQQLAELTQQICELEAQERNIQNILASVQLQRNFIQSLSEKSVERFSKNLASQQVGINEARDLVNFLGQHYNGYSSVITQNEQQRNEINQQLQILRQQLQKLQTPRVQESLNLIVTIAPTAACNFEIEVSYVINRASWIPIYDLQISDNGERVNINYLAEVQQHTGEDWIDAFLTLSTAKPELGTLPPKLNPWYVDVLRPRVDYPSPAMALPSEPMRMPMQRMRRSGNLPEDNDEADAMFAVETVAAEVLTQGGVVTFQLKQSSNIPSDGTPHKVTIFSDDYPCRKEYIAIPRLVSFAYLQATVTNPQTGATLLPGKANIFRDNTFVGTTQLENIAPGQEFKLNLGIDESLKIERDLVERQVDKKLIGNHRRTTYAYRLVITNLREEQVTIKLSEQIPLSRNEQIKVRLTRCNPQIEADKMGILEWSLLLPPQSKQEIYYQFLVEHSPDLTVVGLNI
jgi:uncharacterized protein (TIGR02231 family)